MKNNVIYLALTTTFISGVAVFVNKYAVTAIKDPLVFTAVKNGLVGILILALLIATSKWKLIKSLNKKDSVYLLLVGVVGGAIPFYLFFTGLSLIPAINAALIHKTLVFWVALFAIPLLKERMSKTQILGVLMLFAGNLLIGGFKGFTFSKGELFVLIATILWGVENVIAKKALKNIDPDLVTAARMGFGSLILLAAAALTSPNALKGVLTFSSSQWFWVIISSAALLGYVMSWYRALKMAPATFVSSILVAATLITNILSGVFITHSPSFLFSPQFILIAGGIIVLVIASKKQLSLA
ncbi:MAG TPA: DMT family transporter [Patescibacteria group bacterium]|nr:DMT family transporter [Patescibacteria group bacterium]